MLFFPAGWESVDASTVLGKLDCMDMAVHWREKLSISYLAVTELLANLPQSTQNTLHLSTL